MDPIEPIHRAATSKWGTSVVFLITLYPVGHAIFELITKRTMPGIDWMDLMVKLLLCGLVLMLQLSVRALRRKMELERLVDTYISLHRAELFYNSQTSGFRVPSKEGQLRAQLENEAATIFRAITAEHDEIRPRDIKRVLNEHYGTMLPEE